MKANALAEKLTGVALRQLQNSYLNKIPRITQIRKFRALYNNQVQRMLRIRYNAPNPIFAGMMDTLAADLDDTMIVKYEEDDPADWMAAQKANAALKKEMESQRPGAMWTDKFRMARFERLMTGRGYLKFYASNYDGFDTTLTAPTFEDMFFEPKGGAYLENHMFRGEMNIWKTASDLKKEAGGVYNSSQVKKLLDNDGGSEYKAAPFWENYDFANRFLPLGMSPEANNYIGDTMFHFVEWELYYEGQYWYLVFEPYTMTWVRFEKLTDCISSGLSHWMSFASHPDPKNFASKGFADDLYPLAVIMTDFLNEDLENRKRMNSGARAYDKDMFPNVAALDEAQMGRDRLVPVDTKGGTRKIQDGIYHFETPEVSGTLDVLKYIEDIAGRNFGVTDIQQGDQQAASKTATVSYMETSAMSKRLSYLGQADVRISQELGMRFFGALKDYLNEPLSIKLLGQEGYNWDTLKRTDLTIKRDFVINVSSQNQQNQLDARARKDKMESLNAILQPVDPNFQGNIRVVNEHRLREGGWSEAEIALMLDPNTQADKETLAKTSEVIQLMMQGKEPPIYYGATGFFLSKILDFVMTHQGDKNIKKNMQKFVDYIQKCAPIAQQNEERRAQKDILQAQRSQPIIQQQDQSQDPPQPGQPQPTQPQVPQGMPSLQPNQQPQPVGVSA